MNTFIRILHTLNSFILGEGEIISGPQIGKPCHFPYVYKGVNYNGCIMEDSPGQPWCSSDKVYSNDNVGHCKCSIGNNYSFITLINMVFTIA